MPEDTSKLLSLLEDLAIIAEDATKTEGLIRASINNLQSESTFPVEVHMSAECFSKFKRHYPGKVKTGDHDETRVRESIIFFDVVEVFCLIERPKTEVDINVVPAQAAI